MLQSSTHWNKYTPCDTAAEEMCRQASTYALKLYPLEQIYSLRHGCRGMCRQASIYAPKLYPLEQIYSLRHSRGGNGPTSLNICCKALPIGTNILLATQLRRKCADKPQHMLQSSTHWNKYTPCDTAAEEMCRQLQYMLQSSTHWNKYTPCDTAAEEMGRQASTYAPKLYPLEQIYSLRHSRGGNGPTSLNICCKALPIGTNILLATQPRRKCADNFNICSKALPIGTNILLATQLRRKWADKPQHMLQSSTHWNKYTPCDTAAEEMGQQASTYAAKLYPLEQIYSLRHSCGGNGPTSLNICSKALPIGTNILLATQPRRKWANKPQHMLQSSTHWNKYTPCDTAAEEMCRQLQYMLQSSTHWNKYTPCDTAAEEMGRQASTYAPKLYPLEQIYSLRHSCGGNGPTSLNICSKALPIGTNILLATQPRRKWANKPQHMLQSSTHWNKYTPCDTAAEEMCRQLQYMLQSSTHWNKYTPCDTAAEEMGRQASTYAPKLYPLEQIYSLRHSRGGNGPTSLNICCKALPIGTNILLATQLRRKCADKPQHMLQSSTHWNKYTPCDTAAEEMCRQLQYMLQSSTHWNKYTPCDTAAEEMCRQASTYALKLYPLEQIYSLRHGCRGMCRQASIYAPKLYPLEQIYSLRHSRGGNGPTSLNICCKALPIGTNILLATQLRRKCADKPQHMLQSSTHWNKYTPCDTAAEEMCRQLQYMLQSSTHWNKYTPCDTAAEEMGQQASTYAAKLYPLEQIYSLRHSCGGNVPTSLNICSKALPIRTNILLATQPRRKCADNFNICSKALHIGTNILLATQLRRNVPTSLNICYKALPIGTNILLVAQLWRKCADKPQHMLQSSTHWNKYTPCGTAVEEMCRQA